MKIMEVLLWEEKERYLLELAKEGDKLPTNYNIETLITKEEEIENSQLQKKVQAMQEQIL